MDFPECDWLPREFRAICRGERHSVAKTNTYRAAWGIEPIAMPEVPNVPPRQPDRNKKPPTAEPPAHQNCTHRGPVVREDVSNRCGSRGKKIEIYACDVHGECSLGRYCTQQTVRICLGCEDAVSRAVQ